MSRSNIGTLNLRLARLNRQVEKLQRRSEKMNLRIKQVKMDVHFTEENLKQLEQRALATQNKMLGIGTAGKGVV